MSCFLGFVVSSIFIFISVFVILFLKHRILNKVVNYHLSVLFSSNLLYSGRRLMGSRLIGSFV
jgi:hypothetical protein